MKSENLEFFKLDEIDRKVLIWLLDHVSSKSLSAWMDYIALDYKNKKSVDIDIEKLYEEVRSTEL